MVQVEMLVHTFYKKPLKPGDIIEVDKHVAERWERNRIARIVEQEPEVLVEPEEPKEPSDPEEPENPPTPKRKKGSNQNDAG